MTEQNKITQTPKRDIRLIALDIDGTLLDSKHALTPRVEEAVKAAVAKGIQVVLATGKTRHSSVKLVEQLGITAPAIYLQGLVIYNADGAISHQWKLDLAVARQVITFAEDRGFMVVGFAEDRILARAHNQRLVDGFSNYHEISPEIVGPLQNILREIPINKLIAMGDPKAIKALRWQLDLQLGGKARTMQAGVPWMVEILPPGTSKGIALKQLLKELKVNPEHILAVGDAENDIEMLQLAGVGVAMGQAAQNVKDAADWVTKSCDEDGVAVALERYVLTEPETAKVESVPASAPAVVIEPTTAVTPVQDEAEKDKSAS